MRRRFMINIVKPLKDMILKSLANNLAFHVEEYYDCFHTETSNGCELGESYIRGLFKTEAGKRNMQRLHEELNMSSNGYESLQQFITDSPWSAQAVMDEIARNTCELYASQEGYRGCDLAYVVDESAHLKKGKSSVGVARQWAGVAGKLDNCQVGVYSSLVWNGHSTLVNERLFLPQQWISDPERCEKAGIPEEQRVFKTKPELALEMIRAHIAAGLPLGWVGGDAFYGHVFEFSKALDDMALTFVLDVHRNQTVYLTQPTLSVPQPASQRGRPCTRLRADQEPIRVDVYVKEYAAYEWPTVTVRHGTKGPLKLSIHTRRVWVWDGESDVVSERTLIITRNHANTKIKYSLSNVDSIQTSLQRLAYMQAQRYWVERAFQEAKSELGMSDYQVRKWTAWHHHMALVMLALAFLVKERILYKQELPLLTARDIRLMIVAMLLNDPAAVEKRIAQLETRHQQRLRDIERYSKNE